MDSGAMEKVMWFVESRFTLFHSDGCIRVRNGKANEVMHPSRLVPTLQACGGSVMFWGWFSWSGLGSITLCAQKMSSADYLNWLGFSINGFYVWVWWPVHAWIWSHAARTRVQTLTLTITLKAVEFYCWSFMIWYHLMFKWSHNHSGLIPISFFLRDPSRF